MKRRALAAAAMMGVTMAACICMGVLAGAQGLEQTALVETCRVTMGCVEQVIAADGVVGYAREFAALSPQSGYVAQLCVEEGQAVTKGQLIARLDTSAQEVQACLQLGEAAQVAQPLSGTPAARLADAWQGGEALASALVGALVRAPADGVVQHVTVDAWAAVAAGTPVAMLSGAEKCIRLSMAERDVQAVAKGMQARILHNGIEIAQAVVEKIGPLSLNTVTGLPAAEVTLACTESVMLPAGARVEAEIVIQSREQVPVLPKAAISDDETLWWVANGRCWEIPARTLLTGDETCWVPLQEGAVVVIGAQGLQHGQRVKEAAP